MEQLQKIVQKKPFIGLIIAMSLVAIGMVVGQAIGIVLATQLTGIPAEKFQEVLMQPKLFSQAWYAIMLIQACTALVGFAATSYFFKNTIEKTSFSACPVPFYSAWILVALLVIVVMPFNGWLMVWNKSIQFPEALASLEQALQDKEKQLAELTEFLTNFQSLKQFWIAFVVVAGTAALGEELLFRGVLQPIFTQLAQNKHLGIWITAALFSGIHFQFYGFFPRMLLGVVFGYLYHWSRNIGVPVFAHFVNNGITLWLMFLYQKKQTNVSIEQAIEQFSGWTVVVSLAVAFAIFMFLRNMFRVFAVVENLQQGRKIVD